MSGLSIRPQAVEPWSRAMSGAVRAARAGSLPSRYLAPPHKLGGYWFKLRTLETVRPGMSVLDVGSGKVPALPRDERPDGVDYVGLDVDAGELDRAPTGSYDERVIADVLDFRPELAGRFDVALSLFLFEHIRSLDPAIENVRRYLRPGGVLVAQFAGRRSVHGTLNRLMPHRLSRRIVYLGTRRATRRPADHVFPAYYDHCYASALRHTFGAWSEFELLPQFTGAYYFSWSSLATRLYLGYEEMTVRRGLENLATWYLIRARR